MRVNKFILVERKEPGCAEIRLASVISHSDLLDRGEKCLGGGMFKINEDKKQVLLWDKSFDFGYPEFPERVVCLDDDFEGYEFYYVPDVFYPVDDDCKVNVEIIG